MTNLRYKIGTQLISSNNEVVLIRDHHLDYHVRRLDYLVEIISSNNPAHKAGFRFWISSSIVESYYKPLNSTEKILYGNKNDD